MRTSRRLTHLVAAGSLGLGLAACGGGSDDTDEDGVSNEGEATTELATAEGTIAMLTGDETIAYSIDVPSGFESTREDGSTSPVYEDPDGEFGERTTTIRLLFLPEPSTAQDLIDDSEAVGSEFDVLDQVDGDGVSHYTYSVPSSSNPDEIAFGAATTSRSLDDGSSLQCDASTQRGIDEEWNEDDAAAVAAQMLEICLTFTPA